MKSKIDGAQIRMMLAYLNLDLHKGSKEIGVHYNTLAKAVKGKKIGKSTERKIISFSKSSGLVFMDGYIIVCKKNNEIPLSESLLSIASRAIKAARKLISK